MRIPILGLFLCILAFTTIAKEQPISLAGEWRFSIAEAEHRAFAEVLPGKIVLPGTLDDAGVAPTNSKPATLEGPHRNYDYAGPAYYQRDIEIPQAWTGKRVTLFLERCRWTTKVWIDDTYAGTRDSLVTPHLYDFGTALQPGRHRLTICVDNRVKLHLGRFVSALFGGTWGNMNGIIGRIELNATPPVWIEDVQVYPDLEKRTARVKVRIGNLTGKPGAGLLHVGDSNLKTSWEEEGGLTETTVDMRHAKLWDEFAPNMSEITVRLGDDERTIRFGMRAFSTRGTQFTLNGRTLFLRGTLECSIWPLTGYPPTEVEPWLRLYRIMKSYGLNHVRFHSWCPPDAAFTAADIEGILVQAEAPQANVPTGTEPARDAFIESELRRIVETYGNHPSFCLLTPGNEFGGSDAVLSRWVEMLKQTDPRRLYSSAANAQKTENRQFTITNGGRGIPEQGTSRTLKDIVAKDTRPTIGHEIGQWMYYPDFRETAKWNGVMTLRNFEMIRDSLRERHQLALAPQYFEASGRFATLLYKEEIEVLLRTPGYGGFALLDLHDYPTQGTALVGPLDAFWDSKGFITPEAFRNYCSSTVPLLRMSRRTYAADEPFMAAVDLAHYGPADLGEVRTAWAIHDENGRTISQGKLEPCAVPTGKLTPLGSIKASLTNAPAPCKLTVTLTLEGTPFHNEWNIWVYPAKAAAQPKTATATVCHDWETAKETLGNGGKVVLLANKIYSKASLPGRFLPVFWSPVWFSNQKPNTMGLLCDPKHPLFATFPTEAHTNWQWFNLMEHSRLFMLDETPPSYRPIVQVIDNFERNQRLGIVFEAKVGAGKLLVCGFDPKAAEEDAAGRQLFTSLSAYVDSAAFNPTHELSAAALTKLFASAYSGIRADSCEAHGKRQTFQPENAIDGDPSTYWQSRSKAPAPPYPHELVVELHKVGSLSGLTCLPAPTPTTGGNEKRHIGWIKDYLVYASKDGKNWDGPLCKGSFANDAGLKTVLFPAPVKAKFVKFVAVSGFDPADPIASLAEIELLQTQ